jgi:hypothetical protein
MNELEQKLSRQPLKEIPGGWRAEILMAAESVIRPQKRNRDRSSPILRLRELFWPNPKAWAALAAVWIFIFALNFSMRDKSPVLGEKVSPPSPEMVVELKQQQRLFAELIGANDWRDADRQKLFMPRPRSERVEILVT